MEQQPGCMCKRKRSGLILSCLRAHGQYGRGQGDFDGLVKQGVYLVWPGLAQGRDVCTWSAASFAWAVPGVNRENWMCKCTDAFNEGLALHV